MSQTFECGDNAALVGYLYDECTPEERAAIESHLAICPACAAEVGALGSTRLQLAAWTPPESDFGFRIVSEPRTATVLRPARWWQRPLPAWAQAAAAAVIFGIGLSFGLMNGGDAATTAPMAVTRTSAPTQPAGVQPVSTASTVTAQDLAALEQRLRAEMTEQLRTVAAPSTAAGASDAQVLARVRALIDESEQRQRRELALRTAEVVRDVDAQRQFDYARIQRALGQFEGTTGIEIQRQRQDLNNLIRVSQRPQ
ncbi:MAG TPA: zf-HC2 domain-containing protein [Vicinamibacterales bacterium]|nr:zf-HC2 domain-containing protein [Vicinamibacterales bacterium]